MVQQRSDAASESLAEQLARFRRDVTTRRITTRGIEWSYDIAGNSGGAPLLLLHGGGGRGDVYFAYFQALESEYRLVAPTLPFEVSRVDDAVAGLAAILDVEGIGSCHVLGHSQGGFLAIALSHRLPARLRSLIIASSALPSTKHARFVEKQLRRLDWTPNFILRPVMRFALVQAARLGGTALTPAERRLLLGFVPFDNAARLRRWARSSALLQRDYHRWEKDDRRWSGAVLLFEAGRDRLIDADDAAALRARYPEARVQHFADAGHLDLIIRPAPYLLALRAFLRTV